MSFTLVFYVIVECVWNFVPHTKPFCDIVAGTPTFNLTTGKCLDPYEHRGKCLVYDDGTVTGNYDGLHDSKCLQYEHVSPEAWISETRPILIAVCLCMMVFGVCAYGIATKILKPQMYAKIKEYDETFPDDKLEF